MVSGEPLASPLLRRGERGNENIAVEGIVASEARFIREKLCETRMQC